MIGIVIVSHSLKLAEGVRDLANQMTQRKAEIAIAAGIDDPADPLGTDASQIFQAIESVYSDDGVVVFMDLGSAILSAETALDFFPEDQRENIYLCEAPLVEGVLSAAVQASNNADIDSVLREAREALAAKQAQLNIQALQTPDKTVPEKMSETTREIVLTVENKLGLHARPAAKFVSTASKYTSDIFVKNLDKNSDFVNAKSINQIITLGVRKGNSIMIAVAGPDADAAIAELERIIKAKFDEDEGDISADQPVLPAASIREDELTGIAVSPGVAIGPVYIYRPVTPEIPEYLINNTNAEIERFEKAVQEVSETFGEVHRQSSRSMGDYDASIFEAYRYYLNDPALIERTRAIIREQQINAEAAWQTAVEEMIASYESLNDQLVRDREVDLLDVASQVISRLSGQTRSLPDPPSPSILLASELNPSETAQLNTGMVLGLCFEKGNKTSHSAIMARSLGIPAVFGIGAALQSIRENMMVVVDGDSGKIFIEPGEERIARYRERQERDRARKQEAARTRGRRATSRDGTTVRVTANVSSVKEVEETIRNGGEGVGLFRTEYLFMNRSSPPSEEEQFEIYRDAAGVLGDKPCVIRTIDIGGDKSIPYLNIRQEMNPFLGWRGIRYCLDQVTLFKTQLRAILRASRTANVKLMFPMIATVREVRAAKTIVHEVMQELKNAGYRFNRDIDIGIMIEVPSAVMMADKLIREVDFFSIGTNDLTQYVLAADRTNAKVALLADPFEPSVLKLIRETIAVSHRSGKQIGMCGEMAGDLHALPLLLGFGLNEFSMNPAIISDFKQAFTAISAEEARQLAMEALTCTSADEVRELSLKMMGSG
jgi:multiphosphoryl transfer protein